MNIFPYPVEKYFPKINQDNPDAGYLALTDMMNSALEDWFNELLEIYFFKVPERCPTKFLEELGYWLQAPLLQNDSDAEKRRKIITAIEGHKKRGTWKYDAKPKIDAVTGYDARIYTSFLIDDWIMYGGATAPVIDPASYWGCFGADGEDLGLGITLFGEGTEWVIPGNIYIDCHYGIHTAVLSAAQIIQIRLNIETDIVPAYFRVYLGYLDSSDVFVTYANGIIE